jgi:glutaconate CoA-transferase subunit A
MTPDLVYDQLIGMGCVAKLVFSWGGNPGRRLAASVTRRRLRTDGRTSSNWKSTRMQRWRNAYEAGAAGLPCAIFRGYIGGDLPKVNSRIKRVTCPFTGEAACRRAGASSGRRRYSRATRRQGQGTS